MAYVNVPKDLTKVKTKVALNLTKRQLIGFTIAGLIGFPVYLMVKKVLPNDLSML
ncbi:TPA: PrgI family protein, partial [Enterococcus faecium]